MIEYRSGARSPSERPPIVYVVDDDASICTSLSRLLRSVGLQVRTFRSASEFFQGDLPDRPSCLVLDVRLRGASGLDFQSELAHAGVPIPIVFMTGHGDIPMTVRAMKGGAVEFLTKPFRDQDMLDAVRLGLDRDRHRLADSDAMEAVRAAFHLLTPREQEVMGLVTAGLMNKQIAGKLGLSEVTVKMHRGSVMRKMGAGSLADLVRMSDELGVQRPQK